MREIMKLTYIFHSGFVLEADRSILVFDYWMDPAHVMESVLLSKKLNKPNFGRLCHY